MKITRETLQQIIKEEVAKEINEEYSTQMEVLFQGLMKMARDMGATKEIMDDLLAMQNRHGGTKPSGKPVGDVDMSKMDI